MFRNSKFLLTAEINFELFKTVWKHRFNHLSITYLVESSVNLSSNFYLNGDNKDVDPLKRRVGVTGTTTFKQTLFKLVQQ